MSGRTLLGGILEGLFGPRVNVVQDLQAIVRGACCARCLRSLSQGAIYHNASTTGLTVHWDCRTVEDDPEKLP
jgi:hypothetical protein